MKTMNKLGLFGLAVASLSGFTACEDEVSYEIYKDPTDITFKVDQSTVEFKGNATQPQTITVNSAVAPTVTYEGNFRTASIVDFTDRHVFQYQILPYATLSPSEYKVIIKAGDEELSSTVKITPADPGFLGLGWNLGNHYDTSNTTWGYWDKSEITGDIFKELALAGFNSVRIPATWTNHMDTNNVIAATYLDSVATTVDQALNAGLKVVLNTHHDSFETTLGNALKSPEDSTAYAKLIQAVWGQIATKFANRNENLMFETFNEIHTGDDWSTGSDEQFAMLNTWNQIAVDTIRATGSNNATRWIGVSGYAANASMAINNLVLPKDPANKIAVSVHCYDPYSFCTEAKEMEWGKDADLETIDKFMFNIVDKFLNNGIPVYIGEYGCVKRTKEADEKYRQAYLKEFANASRKYGLSCFLWDNTPDSDDAKKGGKECFNFFNHKTGKPADATAEAAIKAIVDGYNNK